MNCEELAGRGPKWASPTVVYLASEEAQDITGRVIQAGAGMVAVCEGWRRGAETDTAEDPSVLGPKIREMVAQSRKNSGMDGLEGARGCSAAPADHPDGRGPPSRAKSSTGNGRSQLCRPGDAPNEARRT